MKLHMPPWVLALLFLAFGAAAWFGWRSATTPDLPQIALEGLRPDVAQAVSSALEELQKEPRSGAAWGKLGMVLQANGFSEHVEECYQNAERLEPENPRWPYLQGIFILEGRRQEGISLFRSALGKSQQQEERAAILFRLARLLIEDREFEEAGKYATALREIEPTSERTHFALGILAAARDDRPEARLHLQALSDSPFARRAACGLLASLEDPAGPLFKEFTHRTMQLPRDKKWPDAIADEALSLRVNREGDLAPFWDLKKSGRTAEAMAFLRGYVAEHNDAEACVILGSHLFAANDLEDAAQAFRKAARIRPGMAKAHLFLGEILCKKAEKAAADPGQREAALSLYREALAAEEQALEIEPTLALAQLPRGKALKGMGRTEDAIAAFRQALSGEPQLVEAYLALGETLAETGRIPEGIEQLKNAVRFAHPGDLNPKAILKKWEK